MLTKDVRAYLLPRAFNAAVRAGAQVMRVYRNIDDYDVTVKNDNTPLIVADSLAHNKIKEVLGETRIPILSEEGREMLYDERRNWELFWLVDPLDGTVEFIKGNNEFTINIALMSNNECVCAVVYVPYLSKAYVAEKGLGARLLTGIEPSDEACYSNEEIYSASHRLPLATSAHPGYRIALSRSHQTAETEQYVKAVREIYPEAEIIEQGSSYKFCLLAEGVVDYYPRTTHTYEWDTAAAELILAESGGLTHSLPDHLPLLYNKEDLKNPWFECYARSK